MKQEIVAIEINGTKYVPADSVACNSPAKGPKGPLVIIRTHSAGVHVGELVKRDHNEVTLANARRVWMWQGANTLHEMSLRGVGKGSKISEPVAEIVLNSYIEVIPVTEEAAKSLTVAGWPK